MCLDTQCSEVSTVYGAMYGAAGFVLCIFVVCFGASFFFFFTMFLVFGHGKCFLKDNFTVEH